MMLSLAGKEVFATSSTQDCSQSHPVAKQARTCSIPASMEDRHSCSTCAAGKPKYINS